MRLNPQTEQVWFDGQWTTLSQASIPINAHCPNYASLVFEGIRAYPAGIWLLRQHLERLVESAAAYRLGRPTMAEVPELMVVAQELLARNQRQVAYLRPVVWRDINPESNSGLKVYPKSVATKMAMVCEPWGQYVPTGKVGSATVLMSNWNRPWRTMMPGLVKGGASYAPATLARLDGEDAGADEVLLGGLAPDGRRFVLDGSGQNLIIVRRNQVWTPDAIRWNILFGKTLRFFLYHLQPSDQLRWQFADLTIEDLITADEVLLVGTASEVVSVGHILVSDDDGSLIKHCIGSGQPGSTYLAMREIFDRAISGEDPAYAEFLTPHVQEIVL